MGNCGGTLGEVFRKLATQKESRIEDGHLLPDHVHMLIAIPPKYAVAQAIGFIKVRARSIWHRCMGSGSTTSCGSTFGPVAISCRQLGETWLAHADASREFSLRHTLLLAQGDKILLKPETGQLSVDAFGERGIGRQFMRPFPFVNAEVVPVLVPGCPRAS
jgi:REP element-mobilizing transposase RayT